MSRDLELRLKFQSDAGEIKKAANALDDLNDAQSDIASSAKKANSELSKQENTIKGVEKATDKLTDSLKKQNDTLKQRQDSYDDVNQRVGLAGDAGSNLSTISSVTGIGAIGQAGEFIELAEAVPRAGEALKGLPSVLTSLGLAGLAATAAVAVLAIGFKFFSDRAKEAAERQEAFNSGLSTAVELEARGASQKEWANAQAQIEFNLRTANLEKQRLELQYAEKIAGMNVFQRMWWQLTGGDENQLVGDIKESEKNIETAQQQLDGFNWSMEQAGVQLDDVKEETERLTDAQDQQQDVMRDMIRQAQQYTKEVMPMSTELERAASATSNFAQSLNEVTRATGSTPMGIEEGASFTQVTSRSALRNFQNRFSQAGLTTDQYNNLSRGQRNRIVSMFNDAVDRTIVSAFQGVS